MPLVAGAVLESEVQGAVAQSFAILRSIERFGAAVARFVIAQVGQVEQVDVQWREVHTDDVGAQAAAVCAVHFVAIAGEDGLQGTIGVHGVERAIGGGCEEHVGVAPVFQVAWTARQPGEFDRRAVILDDCQSGGSAVAILADADCLVS